MVHPSVQASSALDELELEDVRDQQTQHQQTKRDHHQHFDSVATNNQDTLYYSKSKKPRLLTMPWWEPDPKPFTMPSTKLSPFAISTLPEPVAKLFGGTSMYAPRPKQEEQPQSQQEPATEQPPPTEPTIAATTSDQPSSEPRADTNGCKWVPVRDGDRVAVMIGTSQDFLLFPSFQRLFLRHLSREDFQDRVGRVTVIPCPATTVVVEGRRAHDGGRRQQEPLEEEEGVPEGDEVENQSLEQDDDNRDEYGLRVEQGSGEATATRSWPRWLTSRRSRTDTGSNARATSSLTVAANASTLVESTQPSTESSGAGQTTRGQADTAGESTMISQDTEKRHPDKAVKSVAKSAPSITWTYDWETFHREDYDSSEYSFSSGECSDEETQDALCYYSESTSSGEDADASSSSSDENDDDNDSRARARHTNTTTSSSWNFSNLAHLLLFFKRPPPPPESRRARQRRLRRERWQQHQDRLLQQQQSIPPRFLPAQIRQRMSPTQTRHCWQALEFCRFYVTILMAISLMGAVVYGALHVEQGEKGHGRGPRADVVEPVYRPESQSVDTSDGSSGALGGGGSVVKLGQSVLMVDPVPTSVLVLLDKL
ncbi:hypothetical protein BGZ92_001335 [Podila epicladia]|nr:hypothetical protein BGZ92_001335 [Podila epicladia]